MPFPCFAHTYWAELVVSNYKQQGCNKIPNKTNNCTTYITADFQTLIFKILWKKKTLVTELVILSLYVYACCQSYRYHQVTNSWYNSGHLDLLNLKITRPEASRMRCDTVARGGFRGGRSRCAPPLFFFFAEIGRLILCGHPRQKECTKSYELTLKITIFLCFWEGISPQIPPVPTGVEVLPVLNLGAPSFKKSWIRLW